MKPWIWVGLVSQLLCAVVLVLAITKETVRKWLYVLACITIALVVVVALFLLMSLILQVT
jgi:hypothetical protein